MSCSITQELLSLRSPWDTVFRFLTTFDTRPDNPTSRSRGFPRSYAETIRPIMREWDEFTCNLADSHDSPCVSPYEALNGPRGDESPFQAGLLASDGQHLSDDGHRAVAAELAKIGFAPPAEAGL